MRDDFIGVLVDDYVMEFRIGIGEEARNDPYATE